MTTDPATPSPWSAPEMVAGFASSAPNAVLMRFAEAELRGLEHGAVLDIGCGAGRNALPLMAQGWDVVCRPACPWPLSATGTSNSRASRRTLARRLLLFRRPIIPT